MSRRVKVLHILWSGKIGGTEEYIVNLVKRFNFELYEVTLCFLKEQGEIFDEIRRDGRFRVDFIGIRSGYDIAGAFRLALYLLKNRFDVIHSHMRNVLSTFILSLLTITTPKVLTHHVGPIDKRLFIKGRLFYLFFGRIFEKVVAISNSVRDYLINELRYPHSNRIEVIYNGVDIKRFGFDTPMPLEIQKTREKSKIIGFIGRMEYFKRPGLFVDTAIEILKIERGYHFVMVGDGTELNRCKQMVSDKGLDDSFTFLGYRRDIPSILKIFDALIFTSKGEGFGIVIIEAMAMGVPVFAVNDGAVPEIIRDRENGVLLNAVDPVVIAKEVIEVMSDNTLINRIKINAINNAKNRFSIGVAVRKTEELYERILSR